ncbi:hypothetical protein D3C81_1021240 [compost metagenome]
MVGEAFPAPALMRAGLALFHGQHRVEQQHALLRPGNQIPVVRTRNAQVGFDLFIDVEQRWRHRHARRHRETQAMRLALAVIRVLAQDHHLHLLERRGVERGEYLRSRREHVRAAGLALAQERRQLAHVRAQQPIADVGFPTGFQLDLRRVTLGHSVTAGCARRARRNWNSTLVTSRRSSIGFCTRSLAPACSSVDWLCGLPSPVITSTGRRRLP